MISILLPLLVVPIAAGLFAWIGLARRRANASATAREELLEALRLASSEGDASALLERHLTRLLPATTATVFAAGAATTSTCLASRLGRPYEQARGHDSLLVCELCGTDAESLCIPLKGPEGGLGSVLVEATSRRTFRPWQRRLVGDAAAIATPFLAYFRARSTNEERAASDALTGLPNSRALRDTLKRMVAQAGRTLQPLAVILLDLDHLRRLNDDYGRECGDDALAAVGDMLAATIRASDVAGRYGGEQFLVLLPDTDREGAVTLAEKLREAVSRIGLPGVDGPLSASFGVAALPADSVNTDALVRLADRALHAAKAAGRNRVETAGLAVATPPETA